MKKLKYLCKRIIGKCVAIPILIVLYLYMLGKSTRKEVIAWHKKRTYKSRR